MRSMKGWLLILCCLPLALMVRGVRAEVDAQPNILWITSEDNSPYLGCYGDPLAETPYLDQLAKEGVRFRNAFANAPVCSTARTTLISGMYATSIGAHHHRSRVAIPTSFRLYPEHLREAGYYCTKLQLCVSGPAEYAFVACRVCGGAM